MTKPRGSSATMAHRITPAGDDELFPTQPWGGRSGAALIKRVDPGLRDVWEPACGTGTLVHGLSAFIGPVFASDAYWYPGATVFDFIDPDAGEPPFEADWIMTNPPFDHAEAFVRVALNRARRGVAMLLRLGFLEGQGRHPLLHGAQPLAICAVFSERLALVKGRYDPSASSAAAYAWYIWLKPRALATSPMREAILAARAHDAALVLGFPPGTRERLTWPSDAAFAVRDEWEPAA